jgi:hypothetical protein
MCFYPHALLLLSFSWSSTSTSFRLLSLYISSSLPFLSLDGQTFVISFPVLLILPLKQSHFCFYRAFALVSLSFYFALLFFFFPIVVSVENRGREKNGTSLLSALGFFLACECSGEKGKVSMRGSWGGCEGKPSVRMDDRAQGV